MKLSKDFCVKYRLPSRGRYAFWWCVPRIVPETGDDSGHRDGGIEEVILKTLLK
jgi:hypothetical protein